MTLAQALEDLVAAVLRQSKRIPPDTAVREALERAQEALRGQGGTS